MSLGERDSYYEDFQTNTLPKGEKGKIGDIHSDDLSAFFKIVQKINKTHHKQ